MSEDPNAIKAPQDYVPYERLIICTNTLEGGGFLFEMSGQYPLLIGKGDPPLVWITIPSQRGRRAVVTASKSAEKSVSVVSILGGTQVVSGGKVILSARQNSQNEAVVDQIDLRPFGINVHGDKSGLKVGGMSLTGNRFTGVRTMFNFG